MWTSNPILGSWRSSVGVIRNLLVTIIEHQTRPTVYCMVHLSHIMWRDVVECTSPPSQSGRVQPIQTRGRPSCALAATTFFSPLCIIHIIISNHCHVRGVGRREWSSSVRDNAPIRSPRHVHFTLPLDLTFTQPRHPLYQNHALQRLHTSSSFLERVWVMCGELNGVNRIWILNYYG